MNYKEISKKQFQVAENFLNSKLKTESMKFTNNVMMSLVKDNHDDYEAINEAISQINEVRECISNEAKIKFCGIQLVIENKGEMNNETVERLKNFGFVYQFGSFYNDKDESTTIFGQSPDYWDEDFEEFLKTFHDFKDKKHKRKNK